MYGFRIKCKTDLDKGLRQRMGECIRIWKRLDPIWKHSKTNKSDKLSAYDAAIKSESPIRHRSG